MDSIQLKLEFFKMQYINVQMLSTPTLFKFSVLSLKWFGNLYLLQIVFREWELTYGYFFFSCRDLHTYYVPA